MFKGYEQKLDLAEIRTLNLQIALSVTQACERANDLAFARRLESDALPLCYEA